MRWVTRAPMRTPSGFCFYFFQAGNRLKIDKEGIVKRALLHQNDQRRATAESAGIVAMLRQATRPPRIKSVAAKIEGSDRHDG